MLQSASVHDKVGSHGIMQATQIGVKISYNSSSTQEHVHQCIHVHSACTFTHSGFPAWGIFDMQIQPQRLNYLWLYRMAIYWVGTPFALTKWSKVIRQSRSSGLSCCTMNCRVSLSKGRLSFMLALKGAQTLRRVTSHCLTNQLTSCQWQHR